MVRIPRVARNYLNTLFFHVIVQGIKREYIFKKKSYINRYLNLIKEKLNKEKLELIAYCIMNNHAHILIKVEDIKELSIYMQKINTAYAKYYNYMEGDRVGYVFKDRFKSEPIKDRNHLIKCIKYIHRNPVKANIVKKEEEYEYSSYNYYNSIKGKESKIFTMQELEYICDSTIEYEEEFLDVKDNKNIEEYISIFIKKEKIKVFEIFEKRDILKKLIKYLKSQKVKYTDIMKILEITKGTMERLKIK